MHVLNDHAILGGQWVNYVQCYVTMCFFQLSKMNFALWITLFMSIVVISFGKGQKLHNIVNHIK